MTDAIVTRRPVSIDQQATAIHQGDPITLDGRGGRTAEVISADVRWFWHSGAWQTSGPIALVVADRLKSRGLGIPYGVKVWPRLQPLEPDLAELVETTRPTFDIHLTERTPA